MTVTKIMLALASVAVSLILPLAVVAQGQGGAPPSAIRADKLAMYRATGIDKEQESKLLALTKEYEDVMLPKAKTLVQLLSEMQGLSLQPDPDQNTVLSKQDEINKVNGDISNERLKFSLKMRNVLTPEQKEKFVQLMKESYGGANGSPHAALPKDGEQGK